MPANPSLLIRWQGFRLPKRGHSEEEYEDAYAARGGRFAVADGASESSFAALWARLLVEGFVQRTRAKISWGDWLTPLRQRWASKVDGLELPWYAEAKREEGAFAAFLGLKFRRSREGGTQGHWRARAIGDSCLFHVREDCLVQAFPLTRSQDFDNRPDLLGSRPVGKPAPRPRLKQCQGEWRAGDCFFLATDALAEWFLRQHEAGLKPWQVWEPWLHGLEVAAAFAEWVEGLRSSEALRNDDVTLLGIALEGSATAPPRSADEAAAKKNLPPDHLRQEQKSDPPVPGEPC